jgi:hypothetical protein
MLGIPLWSIDDTKIITFLEARVIALDLATYFDHSDHPQDIKM